MELSLRVGAALIGLLVIVGLLAIGVAGRDRQRRVQARFSLINLLALGDVQRALTPTTPAALPAP